CRHDCGAIMVSHLPIPFSHHPSRITLGFAMRGDGRVIGHNQLRDPLNKFERTHMRADPGVHTHIRERATIHVTRIWQHRNEQIRLSNLTSHRINELNRVPGPIHEHGPAWLMMQRGNQDRKSTRLNSSHVSISYAVFCSKKKMRLST